MEQSKKIEVEKYSCKDCSNYGYKLLKNIAFQTCEYCDKISNETACVYWNNSIQTELGAEIYCPGFKLK